MRQRKKKRNQKKKQKKKKKGPSFRLLTEHMGKNGQDLTAKRSAN